MLTECEIAPAPFGTFVIRRTLRPRGDRFSRQVFAVTNGFAITDAGWVRLDVNSGRWR